MSRLDDAHTWVREAEQEVALRLARQRACRGLPSGVYAAYSVATSDALDELRLADAHLENERKRAHLVSTVVWVVAIIALYAVLLSPWVLGR